MVSSKLFVEGGGDSDVLRTACRKGFTEFLKKTGVAGQMPRVVSCGSRKEAYDDFCVALSAGERAFLLVDSEDLVNSEHAQKPWQHLAVRPGDQWTQPTGSTDEQCHLMVACMESWFLADRQVLTSFFGQGFNGNALPAPTRAIESITKQQVYDALSKATSRCKTKAPYGKGEHSFKLLVLLNPDVVSSASPWAKRFIDELKK
jgi:hypothetical protein